MDPAKAQSLCQLGILIFGILTACCGWGIYHFGEIKAQQLAAETKKESAESRSFSAKMYSALTELGERMPSLDGTWYRQIVASVYSSLEPHAKVTVGPWIPTSDGIRRVDIWVRGNLNGRSTNILIKCIDKPLGVPVTIEEVDAIDSIREDLGVNEAFICSNTGFTEDALSKAARKNIGMIGVLMEEKGEVRPILKSQALSWKYTIKRTQVAFEFLTPQDKEYFTVNNVHLKQLSYLGKPLLNWIGAEVDRMAALGDNEWATAVKISFKRPLDFATIAHVFKVRTVTIDLDATLAWFTNEIVINAQSGIYDYLHRTTRLAPDSSITFTSAIADSWRPIAADSDLVRDFLHPKTKKGVDPKSVFVVVGTLVNRPGKDSSPSPDLNVEIASREVLSKLQPAKDILPENPKPISEKPGTVIDRK